MILMLRMLATVLIAVTTLHQPTVIKANTKILCELGTTIDSRDAQPGDSFILRVNDDNEPALYGAVIKGHITDVVQPHGLRRAEVGFLLDTISFATKATEPIRAYVVSPNVVQHTVMNPAHVPAYVPPGNPPPSTIVFQTQIGGSKATASTGGYAYAPTTGKPIVAHAGSAVTIELASDLQVP